MKPKLLLVPKGPYDAKNIFLEIRASASGNTTGARLVAAEHFRMYSKVCREKEMDGGDT